MVCPAVNVKGQLSELPTDTRPTRIKIFFVMDGVTALRNFHVTHRDLSSFLYYPDPSFTHFLGEGNILFFSVGDEQLELLVSVVVGVILCSSVPLTGRARPNSVVECYRIDPSW